MVTIPPHPDAGSSCETAAAGTQIMKFRRRLLGLLQLCAALGAAFNPRVALAYEHPLSEDVVREAYFVGQDVKNVSKFFAQYTQGLPVPPDGPYVAEIALSTPYAQVVEVSARHSVGYSDLQAAEDYGKRGDFIAVRVKVLFTPTYTGRPVDFWRDFSVGLVQKERHMAATSVDSQPIYASNVSGGNWVVGANMSLRFSVVGVESSLVQVEVVPPEGPTVHATFDLKHLR